MKIVFVGESGNFVDCITILYLNIILLNAIKEELK